MLNEVVITLPTGLLSVPGGRSQSIRTEFIAARLLLSHGSAVDALRSTAEAKQAEQLSRGQPVPQAFSQGRTTEQLSHIDERQKFQDSLDAGFDECEARLGLLRPRAYRGLVYDR
jgi:hypothetical protein